MQVMTIEIGMVTLGYSPCPKVWKTIIRKLGRTLLRRKNSLRLLELMVSKVAES